MKRLPWWYGFWAVCLLHVIKGAMEETFKHCCNLGTNRASEELTCNDFPAPVNGIPPEQQSICLSAVEICCLKKHREQQCEIGKGAARSGTDCLVAATTGGEYRKDCCDACKLGLISGSMGMGCIFQNFAFGIPWDVAYRDCCLAAQPFTTPPAHVTVPATSKDKKSTIIPTPALDSLCDLLPGELCAHICVPIPGSFRCLCHEGFTLMADGKSCQHDDLPNRCKLNNPCAHKCLDTGVAIECSCHPGYQLAIDERSCNDIDECILGIHTCEPDTQICRNEPGSYTCVNKDGSVSKPATVETGKLGAPSNFDAGKCPAGYQYNFQSQVCDDIDECLLKTANCEINSGCQNTIGSFICVRKPVESCPPGYRFNDLLQSCADIDECSERLDTCQKDKFFCVNTVGNYTCQPKKDSQCPAGYKYNKALSTCEDVDECAENLHGCVPDLETCRNTVGAYECDMKCDSGYQYSLAHRMCIDVDECKLQTHNCQRQCVNTIGSYSCVEVPNPSCEAGYKPRSGSQECEDVNECEESIDSCDKNHEICINEVGSYRCDPKPGSTTPAPNEEENMLDNCEPGYSYSYDRQACLDVNECLTDLHNCSLKDGEECVNMPGSFMCKLSLKCPKGYNYNKSTMKCEDIDECALGTHTCSIGEQCVNNLGGYWCNQVCRAGYMFDRTSNNCVDIDECQNKMDNCNKNTERCVNTEGNFQCAPLIQCESGYRLSSDLQCEDINECEEQNQRCHRGERCVNTRGSYRCVKLLGTVVPTEHGQNKPDVSRQCPAGFKFNALHGRCFDVNECEEGTHVCSLATEVCLNEPGGYRCGKRNSTSTFSQCQPGFKFNEASRTCVDNDECQESVDPVCDSNQDCRNTVGSYTCVCKNGFQLDPVLQACVDINECQVNQHNCLPSQRCDNTIGSFHCIRFTSCGTGYTLNAQTGQCEDDDECILGTDNCRTLGPMWQCRNTYGSFRCERKRCDAKQVLLHNGECKPLECPNGYEPAQHGQCIDINECETSNPCRRNQHCVNTPGSYRCVNLLNCPVGYEINESGNRCLDIDECAKNTHDCKNGQQCINSPGGYICQCPQGHTLNHEKECVDIDECAKFAGQICAINSECHNTVGSYRCICKDGFRQDPKGGNSCIDIDECSDSPGLCHQNCVNIWGSYRCSCNQGFTLHADNRTCQDIDECEHFKDRNLCVGICVNEPGSYRCQCPDGYRLGANGHTCQDIDECIGGNVCRNPNEVCLNTRGSYRCNAIQCPPHFVKDPEHKNRCKRESLYCREGDTECLQLPTSYSFNYITFVSNLAIPPSGYIDLFTMRGPLWSGTNVRFKLEMLDSRAPVGVSKANKDFFQLRRTAINQAIISLVKSIHGPQDIELQLTMELFHSGIFGGAAVAKLYIIVSQFEF